MTLMDFNMFLLLITEPKLVPENSAENVEIILNLCV